VELPPLRARGADVLMVARHFLAIFAKEEGKRFRGFAREAEGALARYPWPGNVRQLQNVVRNIVVLHDGERVEPAMLPPMLLRGAARPPATPPASAPGPGEAEAPAAAFGPPGPDAPPAVEPTPPPAAPWSPPAGLEEIQPLAEVEKRYILAALDHTAQDVPRAASLLGINPSTIYRKLQAWRAGEPAGAR